MNWIGVDLDGTLAHYEGWEQNADHLGEPIPAMLVKVQWWLSRGIDVRIFTARVSRLNLMTNGIQRITVEKMIDEWCITYLGRKLPITCEKDYAMEFLYDDRCITVEKNTGRILTSPLPEGITLHPEGE